MKLYLNNNIILDDIIIAKNFKDKLFGRIFLNKSILLENCASIHTFFLKKNLDIYFLDKKNKVIKITKNLPPGNIILPVQNAKKVLETDASLAKSVKINLGDILEFKE